MSDRLVIGFSGSRDGMTADQANTVGRLLDGFRPEEVHHGDCVGADTQFHLLTVWQTDSRIVIHPPSNPRFRAWCESPDGTEPWAEKPYHDRNRDIVDECDLLIAAPKSIKDTRGGTWYTFRYANERNRWVILVHPDGKVGTN
jgi:hypothetical protein